MNIQTHHNIPTKNQNGIQFARIAE